jgi:hypothetical protein
LWGNVILHLSVRPVPTAPDAAPARPSPTTH